MRFSKDLSFYTDGVENVAEVELVIQITVRGKIKRQQFQDSVLRIAYEVYIFFTVMSSVTMLHVGSPNTIFKTLPSYLDSSVSGKKSQ